MKSLVLFGVQGAGKGTQAKLLAEKYGFVIFETGAELRKLIQDDSELGRKIRAIVERGDLVPNEIVMEIVAHFIDQTIADQPILFDGLPRSLDQKQTFDALLKKYNRDFFGICIEISKEEALDRLLKRGRNDDHEAAIARRIENFENETIPVIQKYEEEGILTKVDGMKAIEEISEEINSIVEKQK